MYVLVREIENYILQLKVNAKTDGNNCLVLTSKVIHDDMGLKQRMPSVCNAMRNMMNGTDEILHVTPSGYSSTFQVKYYL